MKLKTIGLIGLILCLLISMVSAGDIIGIQDGKIQGEPINHAPWWYSLFNTKPLSFADTTAVQADSVCTKVYTSAELSHLGGSSRPMGASCTEGQFASFTAVSGSSDGEIIAGRFLFDKLWYISSSTDVIASTNYYFHQKAFMYKYSCYTCKSASTTDTEPGCLSSDGTECVEKSDSSCKTWYGYQSVCLTHTSSAIGSSGGSSSSEPATTVTPKIVFGNDIKVSKDGVDLIQGKTYEIKGTAYVTGQITGGVIETGFTGDYFQALTVTAVGTGKGVCGDDQTTGLKFTAKDSWVVFTLPIKPTTLGRQRLKVISSPGCGSGIINDELFVTINVIAPTTSGTDSGSGSSGIIDCTNTPTAPVCLPVACTGAECDLTVCDDNCTGGSSITTNPDKSAPSWTDMLTPLNILIGIFVILVLVLGVVAYKNRKTKGKRHRR